MVFRALQPENLVLRLAALAFGGLQFVLGGGEFPARRLLGSLGGGEFFPQACGLGVQLFQFRRPAQHAGGPGGGTAGHGAAPVDDLPVQRDNTEGVAVLPGHGDAAVQIFHNYRPA